MLTTNLEPTARHPPHNPKYHTSVALGTATMTAVPRRARTGATYMATYVYISSCARGAHTHQCQKTPHRTRLVRHNNNNNNNSNFKKKSEQVPRFRKKFPKLLKGLLSGEQKAAHTKNRNTQLVAEQVLLLAGLSWTPALFTRVGNPMTNRLFFLVVGRLVISNFHRFIEK